MSQHIGLFYSLPTTKKASIQVDLPMNQHIRDIKTSLQILQICTCTCINNVLSHIAILGVDAVRELIL